MIFLGFYVNLPSDLNDFMNIEPILHKKIRFIIPFIPESTVRHTIELRSITFTHGKTRINSARSKYRGSGAGEKQKARM